MAAVTVVATDGHHSLGGADVDQRILEAWSSDRLEGAYTTDRNCDDLLQDERHARRAGSRNRRQPSVTSARRMSREVVGTHHFRAPVSDVSPGPTWKRSAATCSTPRQRSSSGCSTKAQARAGAVDDVIMVGGSSRIPALADRLQQMLGVSPRLLEPDLGVAKGAALRAHHLARTPQLAALSQYSRQVRDAAGGPGEPGDPPGDRHSG